MLFVCNSVRIAQNVLNEVLVERSILTDTANYMLYLDSFNGKLNGSRKDNMHRFIWTKKTTKAGFRVKPLGIGCKIPHSCLC